MKVVVYLFTTLIFISCITNTVEQDANENASAILNNTVSDGEIADSAHIISKNEFDSLMLEGKVAHRQNVTAMVDGVKFTSTSFTVNAMDLKGTTVYAIYATNGSARIIINYRGKPQEGIYDMVANADAIYMTADNKLYNAVKGNISFTKFDVGNKILSGTFNFLAEGNDEKKKQINVTGGSFSDLEFY